MLCVILWVDIVFLQAVIDIDDFASQQKGRVGFGKDTSIGHYLGQIPVGNMFIVHATFTPDGRTQLTILKALSRVLCASTITANAHKIILVKKELVRHVFGTRLRGRLLHTVAIGKALGAS